MDEYKHIETCIGRFIEGNYLHAVEVGIGRNTDAAQILSRAGKLLRSTDIKTVPVPEDLAFVVDDVFLPDISLYENADVIYAIRPAIEMVPSLIMLAQRINCDLIVYHLGFESYGTGGEKSDCGVILHRYNRRQNPSNRVD
ncbi:MAG TPA: UPF0146 family protein [Methanoregula sp.]|nr:UPF0146 family protein [Methanoregula sp.]